MRRDVCVMLMEEAVKPFILLLELFLNSRWTYYGKFTDRDICISGQIYFGNAFGNAINSIRMESDQIHLCKCLAERFEKYRFYSDRFVCHCVRMLSSRWQHNTRGSSTTDSGNLRSAWVFDQSDLSLLWPPWRKNNSFLTPHCGLVLRLLGAHSIIFAI